MKKIVIGGLIALLLTGCSKLNRENYDQLKMALSQLRVERLILK